ncbi:MAG: hypothetical protein KDD94_03960 [Calditrichaeota bacterium]|nr:hypothetical protein [Calditrichota bacterium]
MINFRKLNFILLSIFIYSCSNSSIADPRSQRWSNLYNDTEKISITYSIANKHFEDGKQRENGKLLRDAKKDFQFLVDEYQHDRSADKLKEIDQFLDEQRDYYGELIEAAKQKNYIFTTAGYYKKILNYFPEDEDAMGYQENYKTEIAKRLQTNLELGFKYLKENKFNSATRCFNRVLTFEPNSGQAKKGIKQVKYYKHKAKLLAEQRAKIQTKKVEVKEKPIQIENIKVVETEVIEEIPELSDDEKERLYKLGVAAYNRKDFLKAFDFFDSINDENYRDTIHYLTRSEEKIETLGLSDD